MNEAPNFGMAQSPMPKWYNPNKFNAADAAFAYAMSALGLLFLQFYVVFTFSNLKEIDFAVDIIFTIFSQAFMVGLALLMGKCKNVNVVRGGGMYLDGKQSHFFAVCVCFIIAITLFSPLTDLIHGVCFTPEEQASMQTSGEGPLLYVLYVLIVVCPAIGEEMLFRGVIANGFKEYGKVPAVLFSAVAFTLMHTNPLQTVYQFMLGILLGVLYVETKNLLPCMLLHGLNNALSGLSGLAYDITNPTLKIVYYAVTVALGVALLVWFVYASVNKDKKQNKLITALYPPKSPYFEELHKMQGRYFACVKTARITGFTDETVDYKTEQSLKKPGQGKWFFHERSGWRFFNQKSTKGRVIAWFTLACFVNLALWMLVLATLKDWIIL